MPTLLSRGSHRALTTTMSRGPSPSALQVKSRSRAPRLRRFKLKCHWLPCECLETLEANKKRSACLWVTGTLICGPALCFSEYGFQDAQKCCVAKASVGNSLGTLQETCWSLLCADGASSPVAAGTRRSWRSQLLPYAPTISAPASCFPVFLSTVKPSTSCPLTALRMSPDLTPADLAADPGANPATISLLFLVSHKIPRPNESSCSLSGTGGLETSMGSGASVFV